MWSKVLLLLAVFCVIHANLPEFDTKIEEVYLRLGSSTSVWCNASGDQPITYKFYTDDEEEIPSDSSNSLYSNATSKGAFLTFNPVQASHNRSYTCTAMNTHGFRVKMFNIIVWKHTENITIDETDVNVRIIEVTDTSVKFSVDTYADSIFLNVSYQEAVEKILKQQIVFLTSETNGTMFEIRELIPSGRYSFKFNTNSSTYRLSQNSTQVEVILLPPKPYVIYQSIKDNSVELKWMNLIDDFYRNTIDRYSISYNIIQMVGGNDWKASNCTVTIDIPNCISHYIISGFYQKSFYEIRVQARTAAGYGEPHKFTIDLS